MQYLELRKFEGWLIEHSNYNNTRWWERIDYKYKSDIMKLDICKDVNTFNWYMFLASNENYDSIPYDVYDLQDYFDDIYSRVGVSAILEAYRLNNARYHRTARLRKRIIDITSSHSYFLTFTFSDDFIDSKVESKRKYVQRFLKEHFNNYVGNVDYGFHNNRIHFHAVACAKFFDPNLWKYGNLDYEVIFKTSDDDLVLARYIDKLVNHAIKETTKRNSLIYCRVKKNNS